MKIVSSGKTMVDRAAIRAARRAGLETGGTTDVNYPSCLYANVRDSDATIYFYDDAILESSGREAARHICSIHDKPLMIFRVNVQDLPSRPPSDDGRAILDFISRHEVIHVAGNPDSCSPGLGVAAEEILGIAFGRLACTRPL